MVERLMRFLRREWGGLHEAAFLLGGSALASQILGLFRDRLLASSFGAERELDVYYAAFRLPDFLYVSIASFVSVTVVLPFLADRLVKQQPDQANRLFNTLFFAFLILMLAVLLIAYLFLPILLPVIAPGFDGQAQVTLLSLSRILLLSPLLLGLSNLIGTITQLSQRFLLYALSPIFYNLGIIAGVLWLVPRYGLVGLVYGVVGGAFLHLLIQVPGIINSFWRPRMFNNFDWAGIRQVAILSLPRTLTLSANQITIMVLLAVASYMAVGSIAVFNFAYNLQAVPLAIVGVSYSVAAFPTLVKLFSAGEAEKFLGYIATAIRHILFWSLPIIFLFVVLRAQIVRVVLGAGEFDWQDTRLTAAALAIFVVSVAAQSLVLLLVRSYYAGGKTKPPLIINVTISALIVFLALLFFWLARSQPTLILNLAKFARVEDVAGAEILILPLAFSIGLIINSIWLWFDFEHRFGKFPRLVRRSIYQSFGGSLIMGVVAYLGLNILAPFVDQDTFFGILLQGAGAMLLALVFGLSFLWWQKNAEIKDLLAALKKKAFRRAQAVVPEPEGL